MIIDIFLTDITATFGMDKKEVTIDWIVFSNDITEFPIAIAVQGTTDVMIAPPGHPLAGKALGWLQPGMPYSLGSDVFMNAYAGEVIVSNRKIISGKAGQRIDIANGQMLLVPQTPENTIVQWSVQQKYSTLNFDNEGLKVTIKFSVEMEEVPFVFDQIHGYPVMNSAGQLFNPPTTMKRKIPVYTITRRELVNPIQKAFDYTNVVNFDLYYGAPPGTLLLDSVVPDYNGNAWSVSYNIKQRTEGWYTYLLDTGYEEIIDGKLHKILDDDGVPVSEPAKLDGNGSKLDNQFGNGAMRGPYKKYKELPFAPFGLPDPFLFNTLPVMPQ